MKLTIFLITLLLVGCNTKPSSDKSQEAVSSDSVEIEQLPTELFVEEHKPKKKLYLNGIYEYDYPNDSKDMNENQYIAFKNEGDSVQAWYFGTSDEFDEAREGYLPGYFVSQINNLTTNGDSIFFSVSTGYDHCYSIRFPIGIVDNIELNNQFEKWSVAYGKDQTINYSGKLDGLKLYVEIFGEIRTYRKTRNYFHLGINNYDPNKCQIEPLLKLSENINDLSEQMILDFLSTFSVICEANAEFSEWSNELLFMALSDNPELVLKVLERNADKLDTANIFNELESPLHDFIPIDSITSKIEPLNLDERIKNSVVRRLESLK